MCEAAAVGCQTVDAPGARPYPPSVNGSWQVIPDPNEEKEAPTSWSSGLRRVGGLAFVFVILAASAALMLDRSSPAPANVLGVKTSTATPTSTQPPTTSRERSADEVPGGPLNPGTYTVYGVDGANFNVRFTVPAGWNWGGSFLGRNTALRGFAFIDFIGQDVQVYSDPCHWRAAQPRRIDGSVRSLMDALAAQPSLSANTPSVRDASPPSEPGEQVIANQWAGMAIELTVPDDINFADCDGGELRSWGGLRGDARSLRWPGQRDLVWAVALSGNGVTSNGERLIIDAAVVPGTPADVRSEIDAILKSIRVGHWG